MGGLARRGARGAGEDICVETVLEDSSLMPGISIEALTTDDGEEDSTMMVAEKQLDGNGLDETSPLTAQESFNLGKSSSNSASHDGHHMKHFATERSFDRPTFVETLFDTVRLQPFARFRKHERNERTAREHQLNIILSILLLLTTLLLLLGAGYTGYERVVAPYRARKAYETAVKAHAIEAAKLVEKCRGIDWRTACENLGAAGARRSLVRTQTVANTDEYENFLLNSDDPTMTYDPFCLRIHRMKLYGDITFPYHSSHLLQSGGNQTMALFIQV
jgi:hypothetical protein